MFEDYIITNHAIDRYQERIKENRKEVINRIRKDLNYKKIKQIVNDGNTRHVFTQNSKEFIFKKDGSRWILKTIIKRSRNNNLSAISQRRSLVLS